MFKDRGDQGPRVLSHLPAPFRRWAERHSVSLKKLDVLRWVAVRRYERQNRPTGADFDAHFDNSDDPFGLMKPRDTRKFELTIAMLEGRHYRRG